MCDSVCFWTRIENPSSKDAIGSEEEESEEEDLFVEQPKFKLPRLPTRIRSNTDYAGSTAKRPINDGMNECKESNRIEFPPRNGPTREPKNQNCCIF